MQMSTVDIEPAEIDAAPREERRELPLKGHPAPAGAVVTGTLIAFKDNGRTPLVLFPGQPGAAAVPAAAILDLHENHIGRQVILAFEYGSAARPVIMGLLRGSQGWPAEELPGSVEVDADGQRLVVSAQNQLVLRCGSASITLTKDGKVLIQGSYVSSRSSGVMRIKGGSVQIN
jgi:hypothetical protein